MFVQQYLKQKYNFFLKVVLDLFNKTILAKYKLKKNLKEISSNY